MSCCLLQLEPRPLRLGALVRRLLLELVVAQLLAVRRNLLHRQRRLGVARFDALRHLVLMLLGQTVRLALRRRQLERRHVHLLRRDVLVHSRRLHRPLGVHRALLHLALACDLRADLEDLH